MLLRNKKTEEVCNEYLEELKRKRRKLATRANYHFKIYKYILPNLPTKIKKIQYKQCEELINILQEALSNKTINDVIILLNSILKFAFQKKYIKKSLKIVKLEEILNDDIEIFTDEEQTTLVKYLLSHLNYFNFAVMLSLFTGARVGELSALTTDDLKDDFIDIKHTLQRVQNIDCRDKTSPKTIITITSPKSGKERKIPLLDILVKAKNKLNFIGRCCYVATGKPHYHEPRQLERKFKKLLKKCDIEYRKFHTLRHTFAMNCVRNNMSIETLSELLDHADPTTTQKYYIHFDFLYKKEMINNSAPPYLDLDFLQCLNVVNV